MKEPTPLATYSSIFFISKQNPSLPSMQNTKLIRLLSTLDVREFKAFHQFLRSPYHNSNKQAARLLEELGRYHPAFDDPKLEKESIYFSIHHKGKPYHEGRMNLLMTQLVKLFKQFLAFQEVKEDEFQQSKFRLKAYRKKRLDKAFFNEAGRLEALLNARATDSRCHLEQFQLNCALFFHPATPRYRPGMKSLDNCLQHLDLFFVWEKLRFAALALNRMRIFKEKHEIRMLREVEELFEDEIRQSPALGFYEKIIKMQQTEADGLIKPLIDQMEKVLQHFAREDQQNLMALLLNLAAQHYRMGKDHLKADLFRLYKLGLSNQLFVEDGIMPDVLFANCASISSASGAFEWTQEFIDEYRLCLEQEIQSDAVNLSLAYLNYHRAIYLKDEEGFIQVTDFLTNIDFSRPYYFYRARSLLLRAYYEFHLKKEENLDFVLDFSKAFERQISRDKSIGKIKAEPFLNFIRQTRKLIKLKFDKNRTGRNLEMEKQAIRDNENLFAKNWLMEKIGELKGVPQ